MKLLDFKPEAPLGVNTNGGNILYEMLNEKNTALLTQGTDAVHRWLISAGNGYFKAVAENLEGENKEFLEGRRLALERICLAVAEFVTKEFDVVVNNSIEKERTITVDVPKTRKVGLFRTENYVEKETRTEKYYDKETVTYKGWVIESLYRQEGLGNSAETLILDYCLGADGKLYLVATKKDDDSSQPVIFECVCYSPAFLRNTFCNVYTAAISGVSGVLDAIPFDKNDNRRNVHLTLDDEYYYNFQVQIDDGHTYPYGFLDGVIERLVSLLDDKGKIACFEKYDWMGPFLNLETNTIVNEAKEADENTITTKEKFENKKHNFDFDEYVLLGAEKVSKKPYAQNSDEFGTDANGCFVSAFLSNRFVAAEELSRSYPKFDLLWNMIIDNQKELTAEKLLNERQTATDISNDFVNDEKAYQRMFILLTAYAAFLSQSSSDDRDKIITKMMIDRVCSYSITQDSWEELLIAVALWFSNTNGYKDAVSRKYAELKNRPTEEIPFSEKIDVDLYAQLGAKVVYGQYDGDTNLRFASALLSNKLSVAEKVAKQFPQFESAYKSLQDNFQSADLNKDLDILFNAPELFTETDCAVLVASIATFLDRKNPDRSTSNDCIACVERALNKPGEDVVGIDSITLLCVALWFSDYKGYKEKVYNQIKELKSEGWFAEDKIIDLEDVRETIEKDRFN